MTGTDLTFQDPGPREEPNAVLLVDPSWFQVVDRKNPYMTGAINADAAREQWDALYDIYRRLQEDGVVDTVQVLAGVEDLEDMVFCANQSLPWKDDNGRHHVMMSNMRHASRAREVPYFEAFFRKLGYKAHHIPDHLVMEGMGDSIFHPFTGLLWMGHGYRTAPGVAEILGETLAIPVVPLHLVSEHFYHLDTCFLPVDERTVLLCREAFDQASLERIAGVFEEVVPVSREEATATFCLNTHCIYHREQPVAITPAGEHSVKAFLGERGYRVIEAETSEFIKSGGSVYCMKMMYYV